MLYMCLGIFLEKEMLSNYGCLKISQISVTHVRKSLSFLHLILFRMLITRNLLNLGCFSRRMQLEFVNEVMCTAL